jgi:hypothetical protein
MPYENEPVQRTGLELARQLGCSRGKVYRLLPELRSAGVVFYMWVGRPPRKTLCFWRSELVRWCRLRGHKNEII